jgi:hypothetical protein
LTILGRGKRALTGLEMVFAHPKTIEAQRFRVRRLFNDF